MICKNQENQRWCPTGHWLKYNDLTHKSTEHLPNQALSLLWDINLNTSIAFIQSTHLLCSFNGIYLNK